jgi:hypothetical protein
MIDESSFETAYSDISINIAGYVEKPPNYLF